MKSIFSSITNSDGSDSVDWTEIIKAKSAPIPAIYKEVEVKEQISAPSYFHCLKQNETPPFQKPEREPRPKILIGSIFNEGSVIEMVAAAESDKERGLAKFLGWKLIDKNIIHNHELSERKFLVSLLTETVDYAAQRDFDAFKLSVMLTIYLDSHCYFKWYYWQSPIAVWNYFKELMVRHTIQDSPEGHEVFEPDEAYDILTHFHSVYVTNLPLIHIVTFGTHKLKCLWPIVGPVKS